MSLLHLEPIPARTSKGALVNLLARAGSIDRRLIGRIEISGAIATIDLPDGTEDRLVRALDGVVLGDQRLRAWFTYSANRQATEADHFTRLLRLLELESRAQARQALERVQRLAPAEAERSGQCLLDLVITEEFGGLGGRRIVTLAPRNRALALPWTRLAPGNPVLLTPESATAGTEMKGVLCERNDRSVRVALDRSLEEMPDSPKYRIDLFSDDAALQRQRVALDRARSATGDRLAGLRRVLLGETQPSFTADRPYVSLDPSLNSSQQEAVRFALAAADLAVIHGPPGTGKTTTVVELIRQEVRGGARVLACAPSNLAVDNILERLVSAGERAVRVGHPARVLPGLRDHTLDLMVENHDDMRLAREWTRDAYALFRKAGKFTRARPEPGARRELRQQARGLLADARRLEAQTVEGILDSAAVVCSTTTSLDSEVLGQRRFDLAVIDEACQSTEPGCWIPLLRCQRIILAGDHCQLPPTVISREAVEQGFGISLQERLAALYGSLVTRRLQVQYRMHVAIMAFSDREFYESALAADESVSAHVLDQLPGVRSNPLTHTPLTFIDTAGAGFEEERGPGDESRFNTGEASLVCRKVTELLQCGLAAADLAVITPYAAQARLLRDRLPDPALEIDSVDGFQGREKEAVVLSLVRSNPEGEIGFLADVRRINVALTRARRKLLVVGDSATLSTHPFYRRLFEHFETEGAYHSVWEENDL